MTRAGERWDAAAAGLVLAIAAWTTFAPRGRAEPLPPGFLQARMSLGLAPAPSETVTVPRQRRHELAVRRVALPTDDVVLYRIAFLDEDTPVDSEPLSGLGGEDVHRK